MLSRKETAVELYLCEDIKNGIVETLEEHLWSSWCLGESSVSTRAAVFFVLLVALGNGVSLKTLVL